MNKLSQKILIGIVGVFALPTIAIGGSFTLSLLEGKSVEESFIILSTQIDSVIGRIETLETKQGSQEQSILEFQSTIGQQQKEITQQEAYNEFRRIYDKVWLRGKTEEDTVRDTEEHCQLAVSEGNKAKEDNFCPLAGELKNAWDIYQNSLK